MIKSMNADIVSAQPIRQVQALMGPARLAQVPLRLGPSGSEPADANDVIDRTLAARH